MSSRRPIKKLLLRLLSVVQLILGEIVSLFSALTGGVFGSERHKTKITFKMIVALSAGISIVYAFSTAAKDIATFFRGEDDATIASAEKLYNFETLLSSAFNARNPRSHAFETASLFEEFSYGDWQNGIGLRFDGFPDVRRDGKLALWQISSRYYWKAHTTELVIIERSQIDGSVIMSQREWENFKAVFLSSLENSSEEFWPISHCNAETYALKSRGTTTAITLTSNAGNRGYSPRITLLGDQDLVDLLRDKNTDPKSVSAHTKFILSEAGHSLCNFRSQVDFRSYME